MKDFDVEQHLKLLKKPEVLISGYEHNLRRTLLNAHTNQIQNRFSFKNIFYKSSLLTAAFISLLIVMLLIVDLSPVISVDDILTKAQAQADLLASGKEYREIYSELKYTYDGTTTTHKFVSQYFFSEPENSPTPVPDKFHPDYGSPYTPGVVTFLRFALGFYQVNERYFKCDDTTNYNIGVGENDNPDGSVQIKYLQDNSCNEISKNEFNQKLYEHYLSASKSPQESITVPVDETIETQKDSCGSNDGGRIMVSCWGEYYIQLFPISVQLKEGFKDLTYPERKQYLESLGFRETSPEHASALFEYELSADNLVYQLAYGLSFTSDAFTIFEKIKELKNVSVIENSELGDNLIGVRYKTNYKESTYFNEVYFDKGTYALKFYRELDSSSTQTIFLTVTSIEYY